MGSPNCRLVAAGILLQMEFDPALDVDVVHAPHGWRDSDLWLSPAEFLDSMKPLLDKYLESQGEARVTDMEWQVGGWGQSGTKLAALPLLTGTASFGIKGGQTAVELSADHRQHRLVLVMHDGHQGGVARSSSLKDRSPCFLSYACHLVNWCRCTVTQHLLSTSSLRFLPQQRVQQLVTAPSTTAEQMRHTSQSA